MLTHVFSQEGPSVVLACRAIAVLNRHHCLESWIYYVTILSFCRAVGLIKALWSIEMIIVKVVRSVRSAVICKERLMIL